MEHATSEIPAQNAPAMLLRRGERLGMLAASLACFGLLGLAAWLEPSASGMGTHTQLGIAACAWPSTMGLPCPSCGMTTAFACAADGDFVGSLRAQPGGFILAILVAAAALATLHAALTGSKLCSVLLQGIPAAAWWTLAGLLLVSWGYKVALWKGLFT